MEDSMLSISEASRLMGVCENTLRDWDEEGKFKASRTAGNHRRYSLADIRTYLEKNPTELVYSSKPIEVKIEVEKTYKSPTQEIEERWIDRGYVQKDAIGVDKGPLAIIMDNAELVYGTIEPKPFTPEQWLWLNQQSWLRSKFRKMVGVQPLLGPVGLAHFMDSKGVFNSVPEAAKSDKFGFSFFPKADFEKIKDVYADAIAHGIDSIIFRELAKCYPCNLSMIADSLLINNMPLSHFYHYLIGPEKMIDQLRECDSCNGIDLFGFPTVLSSDSFSFEPLSVGGRYPQSNMELPVFMPYVLLHIGPTALDGGAAAGFTSALTRYAWCNGKNKN